MQAPYIFYRYGINECRSFTAFDQGWFYIWALKKIARIDFQCGVDYIGLKRAIQTDDRYLWTIFCYIYFLLIKIIVIYIFLWSFMEKWVHSAYTSAQSYWTEWSILDFRPTSYNTGKSKSDFRNFKSDLIFFKIWPWIGRKIRVWNRVFTEC